MSPTRIISELRFGRGAASRLPSEADEGEPFYITDEDNHNIYVGNGPGKPLSKVTGVTEEIQAAIDMKANAVDLGTAAAKDVPASGNATAGQVVLGSDTRLSNPRIPTAHKSSHATGGSDELTPADIGLGNVDNTADADKPVSTAVQAAIDAKDDGKVIVTNGDIQGAINSAVGKVAYFHGAYTTTVTLNLPSHTHLVFAPGSTLTNLTTDADLFGHTSDADNADITIEGGTFEGNHSGASQYGIYISGCDRVFVKGVTGKYFAKGFRFKNLTNSEINDNTITYSGFTASSTDQSGLLVEGCTTSKVTRNTVSHNTGIGIHFLGGSDLNVSCNTCWYNTLIGLRGDGAVHSRFTVSKNSCCYNGTLPITADAAGGMNWHGLSDGVISENILSYNNNYGLDVNGNNPADQTQNRSRGLLITKNVITQNANIGMEIYQVKNVSVIDNVLRGNLTNIKVEGTDTYHVDVRENKCYDSTADLANIYIHSGDRITVASNVMGEITSSSTTQMELRVEAAATNVLIGENDFTQAKRKASAYLGAPANVTFSNKAIYVSEEITLSGALFKMPIPIPLVPDTYSYIHRAYVIYTEAASSNAGVVCGVGSQTATATKWASLITTPSAAQFTIEQMTINENGQVGGGSLGYVGPYFHCAGGKTGLGKVKIVVEYIPRFPIYY